MVTAERTGVETVAPDPRPSRLRILVATGQWHPDFNGGTARVATETAKHWAEGGHDVTVLAPRAPEQPATATSGSLHVHRVLARNALPLTFTDVAETARHARKLRVQGFDVLVAHSAQTAVGLSLARFEAPLVVVHHFAHARELKFERAKLPLGRRRLMTYALEPPFALLERMAVRRASLLVALSDYTSSLLAADHSADLTVPVAQVSGGVDVERFTPGDGTAAARARLGVPPGARLLLTVRRLEPRMGLVELLHALRALPVEQDLSLAVVGGGTLLEQLSRLRSELGLVDRVRFVGQVPDAELRDWYRAADLFVLPTAAYEGFGMVTAEALACGTPVVGTAVGATPELLAPLDPRLIARSADPGDLAAAVAGALELIGPELRRRCRAYACERLAWESVMQGWEEAVLAAVGSRSTRANASS